MNTDWNPILLKELRPFLRQERNSYRMFVLIATLLMALAACLALKSFAAGVFTRLGQAAFIVVGFAQWCLSVLAVLPAAMSIAVEREKHTLEGLISSPLRPEVLVRGKLIFAAYVATLSQFALAPVLVGTYLLGGVELMAIPLYLLLLTLHNCFLAGAGIYFSTLPHKTPKLSAAVMQSAFTRSQMAQQKAMGLWVACVLPTIYLMMGYLSSVSTRGAGLLPPVILILLELLDRMRVLGAIFPVFSLTFRDPVPFFNLTLPYWIPALIFNGMLAAMYYRLAVGVVHGRALDKGPGVRVLAALFTGVTFALVLGNLWPATTVDAPLAVYAFACLAMAWFFLILTPALTTGEALEEDRAGRWAGLWRACLRPQALLRHRVGSAVGYLVWLALPVAPVLGLLASRAADAAVFRLIVECAILLVTTVIGYGLFGLSFSIRRRSGQSAPTVFGFVVLATFCGLAMPLGMRNLNGGNLPAAVTIPLQLLAALTGTTNPLVAIVDVVDRALGGTSALVTDLLALTGPLPVPLWTVAAVVNLLLGAVGALRLRGDWAEPPPGLEENGGAPRGEG